MILGGLLLITLSLFHLRVMIKNMNPLKKGWKEVNATILEEREYKLGEVLTDDLGARELKIVYYVGELEYVKYVSRSNWQIGVEEEILVRYNPNNPDIFEEVNCLEEQYGNRNRGIIIFSFIMFIFYLLCGILLFVFN